MKFFRSIALMVFALVAVLAPLATTSPVSAANEPSNNVVKTLGFTTSAEDAFYKFRVPGGGMNCQGKIRYYISAGRQISTIKPAGNCYAVSIKVDYGQGYSGWSTAKNGNHVGISTATTNKIERILYRLCAIPSGSSTATCAKVERTRETYWTLGRCYEKQPLISTTNKPTHKCVVYIQSALKEAGYWPGKVNGIYGSKTKEAVKRFQADANHGQPAITPDGIFGPQTWNKFIATFSYFTES